MKPITVGEIIVTHLITKWKCNNTLIKDGDLLVYATEDAYFHHHAAENLARTFGLMDLFRDANARLELAWEQEKK